MSKKFTFQDLKEFDGRGQSGKIYVALGGKVYDVTKGGEKFYGPGAPYERLAGKDASRALASMSLLKAKDTYDDLSDLNPLQQEGLKRWMAQFEEKYVCVGVLDAK